MCFGKGGDCPLCHFMERERHHGRLPRLAKDATSSDVGTAPAELDGPQPIKYRASLGQRSLHAGAAGRIFLAFLTPEERRQGGHPWRCYGVGPGIRLRRTSRRVGRCPRCPRSPFARRAPSLRRPPSRRKSPSFRARYSRQREGPCRYTGPPFSRQSFRAEGIDSRRGTMNTWPAPGRQRNERVPDGSRAVRWSPMVRRERLTWPPGARIAVGVGGRSLRGRSAVRCVRPADVQESPADRAAAALPDRDTPEIERARPVLSHGIVHDHPLDATGV